MYGNLSHIFSRFTHSLRFKLSFYAGLVVFFGIVIFTLHSINKQETNLINAQVQAALRDSEVVKAAIWNGMMTKDREVIRQIVRAIGKQEGFKAINIFDRTGKLHYTSKAEDKASPQRSAADNPLLVDIDSNVAVKYEFQDKGKVLNVVNPLVNDASCSTMGCHEGPIEQPSLGALEIKLPLGDLRKQLWENARETYVFALFLFLLVSSIIGIGVIYFVSRPIEKLKARANRMAKGEYVPARPSTGQDSIAELSRAFEEMSRQIHEHTRDLEQSRKMYKDLFEKVPCYLTVIGSDYRIVRTNQVFASDFGDQVGRHCFEGFKGNSTKCENCQVERTFIDGLPHMSEEIWHPESSDKRFVVVNTSPIFDEYGKISEVLEMSVDVTKLEQLKADLRKKEQEYASLLENVPCYLTLVDRSYKIAFANSMFVEDFGECVGENCYKVYKGQDTKCENCPVEQTFDDGLPHASEEIWQRDGKDVHIVLQTAPILDENGRVAHAMEMCTNITELKLLRNELANLGETIAGMSHTVKNILSGLEGGVYMVDSGLKRGKEDRMRVGWEMVKKNVERVSVLVKDILYASKKRPPEYSKTDPAKVLLDVYDLYEEKAKNKGVELLKDFSDQMGSAVFDVKGIHSAVSNLISNSIAACSTMDRKDSKIILGGRVEGNMFVIHVTDNGCGMPDQVKQNLFKKFYSTKGSEGTGLGLVVTKKIIEEHGGRIQVYSRLGEGTSFQIEIPTSPIQESQEPKSMVLQ